jgi:hypothetical protein
MTELTNTPERQPLDLMHPDSNTADVQPDPKRHRTRGRHRYLFALVPAIFLTLTMILSMTHISCTALGADSGVSFDLNPVLAHASLPVHVRACTELVRCILGVQVKDPALTFWRPIWVRLRVSDQAGNSIFDSSALIQPHMFQPNGPGCVPTVYSREVVATPTGRLVPQP